MAKKYTVAFLFDKTLKYVSLVRKAKPEWQAGKFNGIGGKLEEGETFAQANVREFQEETGVPTKEEEWSRFAKIETVDTEIEFFAMKSDIHIDLVTTQTTEPGQPEEPIEVENVADVCQGILHGSEQAVENLAWLIAMAKDHLEDAMPTFAAIYYA